MIYFPDNSDFKKCELLNDYKKEIYNKTRFYLKEKSKDIIVYYHGNASSACENGYMKDVFEKTNYSVMFVEFSGYANDDKEANIKNILNDVENINKYLVENKYNKIIVFGRSLGTGPASYQANIGKVDKLILVSPFTSFLELTKSKYPIFPISILLTEKYDSQMWLKDYKNDLLIIHGTSDEVIPYSFGEKLYNSLDNKNKEFFTIKGKGHNDLDDDKSFDEKILDFINK
ncbi:MAG: alpha/beta hydrolase [Candidatus Gracilibacteria bacterium]|nr:alpha/beta hydrolase [Candidatus Gracilibacteria bacterium]